MASILRTDVEAWIFNEKARNQADTAIGSGFDFDLAHEFQTDKERVKLVPCRTCKRPLVVTTFFAPAKAMCSFCRGDHESTGTTATVGQPIPGQTNPARAVNLADCLINRQFASAICPLCSEEMELKSISHAEHYGPRHLKGYKNGVPIYDTQTGESVMLQCNSCKTTMGLSTQHQNVYRRQNEARRSTKTESGWEALLGVRQDIHDEHKEKAA